MSLPSLKNKPNRVSACQPEKVQAPLRLSSQFISHQAHPSILSVFTASSQIGPSSLRPLHLPPSPLWGPLGPAPTAQREWNTGTLSGCSDRCPPALGETFHVSECLRFEGQHSWLSGVSNSVLNRTPFLKGSHKISCSRT